MKQKRKILGASKVGVKVRKEAALNTTSKKILFPEKLEVANKIVSNIKWKTN
jgi:hypothetical protein